jgi:hypothetical protein
MPVVLLLVVLSAVNLAVGNPKIGIANAAAALLLVLVASREEKHGTH